MDAVNRLQEAIRFPTVSHADPAETDWTVFRSFGQYLRSAYPLLFERLTYTPVNDYGLVLHWPGKSQKAPVLLTAHYDVVAATADGWEHPPFSGEDDGESVWGRGTLDDKGSLIAILEAATELLQEDFLPPNDIYFAFGFDEEVGGALGAQQISAFFHEQGIRFRYVLDEGGAVAEGKMMGISKALAVIGIAEKGNNSFRFLFRGEEGHASSPPASTAVGKMAAFIHDVERHPPRARLTETLEQTLLALAPHKRGAEQLAMQRPRLFSPLIKQILLKNKQTAAMLRTTIAFTMTEGGSGHNVLPRTASCVANIRILQGETVENIRAYLAGFSHEYEIEEIMVNEPTAISAVDGEGMEHIRQTIARVFPDAVALPYLMVGGTDCRYYDSVADNAYRFLPSRLSGEELDTMHGRNERISHENFHSMIQFYREFMQNLQSSRE